MLDQDVRDTKIPKRCDHSPNRYVVVKDVGKEVVVVVWIVVVVGVVMCLL